MAKNFEVKHLRVGALEQGRVVTRGTLDQLGYEVDRLVALEAIAETDKEPTTSPIPPGPENRSPRVSLPGQDPKVAVDAAGRVVDSPGNDRPTTAGTISGARKTELHEAAKNDEGGTGEKQNYRRMRVDDLRPLAVSRGIEGAEDMKKDELITALEEDDESKES